MWLGLRRLKHSPGFALAVALTLAIGVAAATTLGSVLYALALRPLNMPDPDALVVVSSLDDGFLRSTPIRAIDHLRAATLPVEGWCAYNTTIDASESSGRVVDTYSEIVSSDCAKVIATTPALGRWFTDEEAPAGGTSKPVVVITDRYWSRMFDRATNVLGRTVRIQNATLTVIGVMPPSYTGFSNDLTADVLIPLNSHRAVPNAQFLARLQPGATVEQLRSQVRTMWPAILDAVMPAGPQRETALAKWTGDAQSYARGTSILRRLYVEPVRRMLFLTIALLALVCTNVGGLLVTRFAARTRETAAMRAIGATTLRVVSPMAVECTTLAIGGAILGIPLAYAASASFATLLPTGNMPWTTKTTPDGLVLVAVAFGLIVMTLMIGAVPIWLASRGSQLVAARSVSQGTNRWAQGILMTQIAVTLMLMFTCGLVMRSFYGLQNVDRGFRQDHLLSLRMSANPGGYADLDAPSYYRSLVDRLAAVPGIQAVGLARYFGTINATMTGDPIGFAAAPDNIASGSLDFVSPGFFQAIGAPLLRGRDVRWSDLPSTPFVAVVSESVARQLSPDGEVVGREIRFGKNAAYARLQIVGVVGNISIGNLRKTEERMVYLSSVQAGETTFASAHLRTTGPPLDFAPAASAVVAELGREHVFGAYSDMLFGNSVVAERMGTAVSVIIALLALVVASIGLFALLSHTVDRRTREIGIRVAIGATPIAISKLVFREAAVLIGGGLILGIPAALAAAALVRSLLYGVSTTDTATLAASALMIVSTAAIATLRPTMRATRVDPATALRAE